MPVMRGGGLQHRLMETFNLQDYKAIFLLYKYARHLLGLGNSKGKAGIEINSFDDLMRYYKCFKPYMTEHAMNALYITDEDFKRAEKYLIEQQHQQKQVALYNKLFEQGLEGDVKSIREFASFSKSFLQNDDEETDEIKQFLKNVDLPNDEDE